MKIISLIFISILVFVACAKHKSIEQLKWEEIKEKQPETVLQSTVLKHSNILWSELISGFVNDSLFLTECWQCDTMLFLYKIKNDSIFELKYFGKKGNGPNELIHWDVSIDINKETVYGYDRTGGKIKAYKFNIENLLSESLSKKDYERLVFPYSTAQYYSKIAPFGQNAFLALGGDIEHNGFITYFDLQADTLWNTDISFPDDKSNNDDIIKHGVYASDGGLLNRPSKNQFFYHCGKGWYAEIITINDDASHDRKVLATDYPLYGAAKDGLNPAFDYNTQMGINVAAVSENRIYFMIQPETLREFLYEKRDNKGYPSYYDDIVYIFDWEGNFINKYQLDRPVLLFKVDKHDTFILAATQNIKDGEIEYVKFLLPK
jgi:hypothetical protein